MFNQKHLILLSAAFLISCSSGGSSSGGSSSGGSSSGGVDITGLSIPSRIEIISSNTEVITKNNQGSSSTNKISSHATNAVQNDYDRVTVNSFIENKWLHTIRSIDEFTCFIEATGGFKLPNKIYTALVDLNKCAIKGSNKPVITKNTIVSTRADNSSPHRVVDYLQFDTNFAHIGSGIIIDVVAITSPSSSNALGEFSFKFSGANNTSDNYLNGYLDVALNSNNKVDLKLSSEQKQANKNKYYNTWVVGEFNPNGIGGTMQAYEVDSIVTNNNVNTYKVNFNSQYANVNDGGNDICYDLDKTKMTTSAVHTYNLYNYDGSLVNVISALSFNYTSLLDGSTKYGYASQYNDGSKNIHYIWTEENGVEPSIIKQLHGSAIYNVSWSNGVPTISGINFDDSINFTGEFDDSNGNPQDSSKLNYVGVGNLWGIPWSQKSNDKWYPNYIISDGTVLIDSSGKRYKVKQILLSKNLATADSSNCSSLPVSGINYAEPTLIKTDKKWSDKPTVTSSPKVIDGVIQ